MLRPEMYPLNACMEQAYEQAHVIAVEVNILTVKPQEMHRLIQENGFYPHTGIYADSGTRPAGQSLQTELSPKTLALLKIYLQHNELNLEEIQYMRPWHLGMLIAQQEMIARGFDPALGIDLHFLQKAQGEKEIIELETSEQQIKLLASIGEDAQELSLLDTLQHQNEMDQAITDMVLAWQSGDAEALYQLVRKSEERHPSLAPFFKRLFDQRNQSMSTKIEKFLKSGENTLVIIGGGHLGGENGLINLLSNKSYTIKQLNKSMN